jgi:hypothetical protein
MVMLRCRCRGRILAKGIAKSSYIDLTCLLCGWSRDVPGDIWDNATEDNLKDILMKADRFEF